MACRAAVYGALVPASRFIPENGPDNKKHILEAHAERLTRETGKKVTVKDIEEGHAPRPKVLDMFAGGGAIPLEAARLGCETHALDLNPVAHTHYRALYGHVPSALVDALRRAGYEVAEAWPLATETKARAHRGDAVLASSIFLVARKREGNVYQRRFRPLGDVPLFEKMLSINGLGDILAVESGYEEGCTRGGGFRVLDGAGPDLPGKKQCNQKSQQNPPMP